MSVNHSIKQNGGLPGAPGHVQLPSSFGRMAFGLISVAKDVAVLADQNEEFGV